jgi:hypothetical protein
MNYKKFDLLTMQPFKAEIEEGREIDKTAADPFVLLKLGNSS